MNYRPPIRSTDISFNSKTGANVVVTLSNLPDRLIIAISELQKVGHIIDVYFPRAYAELSNVGYHRPEFDTKVIFGPDTV